MLLKIQLHAYFPRSNYSNLAVGYESSNTGIKAF